MRIKGENNLKKFTFVISFVLMFLIAFANDSEAAASVHTVKKGDTLYNISKQYKVSVANIKSINNLKSDIIKPNQKLQLTNAAAKKSTPVKVVAKKTTTPSRSNTNVAKEFMVSATAYTAFCTGCSGITKTGINLRKNPHLKVIAVDPKVIKLGTKVHVEGYGYAVAGDIGSAIKGNKIDLFIPNRTSALKWGRKTVKIKILK